MNNEQKRFIELNYLGKTVKELCNLLNKKFESNITENQIINYKKRKKLKSGVNTKFQKLTKPHNYKPLFSEFTNSAGYIEIKVAEPNKWQLKHRYIYEQEYGKLKPGYSVIFADGNKQNFDIDNLILCKVKDKLLAKNKHLIFKNKQLTKTGILIASVINKTNEKIRDGINDRQIK